MKEVKNNGYAIDNDLNYVADKIRNFYEVGEYKTDAEMGQADAQAASDLEKPDASIWVCGMTRLM